MPNKNLQAAKAAKKDEFYTQLTDIEKELRHYKEHFAGKTVLCNCDDPRKSNFFVYFQRNFEHLGLKRLITTCYRHRDVDMMGGGEEDQGVYLIYDGDKNHNNALDAEELDIRPLEGDGDFRSEECIELLKEADIVVTNPPFSLFREYVSQLMKYEKKFLIIGNQGALGYKDIFPLIKENKIWMGYHCGDMSFSVPDEYDLRETRSWRDEEGQNWRSMGNVCWYTNLEHSKRHEPLILYKRYTAEEYPHYANYDAIEVSKYSEIPEDYYGEMGVPITYIDKYCPEQFELVGISTFDAKVKPEGLPKEKQGGPAFYLNNNGELKRLYTRLIIKRKQ